MVRAHRCGHPRRRAGPHQRLVLCDRVLATLIVPHRALAVLLGVDRATSTRAIGQIRPLLAARGFAVARPAHAAVAGLVADRAARR